MTDDAHETSTRIAKLEQQVTELKRMLTRVFTVLDVSTDKEPFLRMMISLDATDAQEADVYNLMGKVDEQLSQSEAAIDSLAFREQVHEIFPSQQPQHLAEAIVTRLARDGGWDTVYEHLRQSGMNLREIREERGF